MLDSPAVRTLSRYLVARFVQLFSIATFVIGLSIAVIELLLNFDRMLDFGDGLGAVLEYLWLRLASEYASYILPIAAFLAAFSTAALSAYAREWLALKAAGIGLVRFALPLVACGVAVAFATGLFHETVVVRAQQEWNRRRDGDANIRFREGAFWYHRGNRIYRVAEADRASRTLREVWIFERDERGRLMRSIAADHIEILDDQRWQFFDMVARNFDPSDPMAPPRIERAASHVLEIADPRDRALLRADPSSLSLLRLREFIEAKEARGRSASAQRSLLFGRLSDWGSIALLVALSIPLGLGVEQTRSLGRSAGYATAALAGFYALRNVGSVLSLQGMLPPAIASIGLLVVLASLAGVGWVRVHR